MSVVRALVVEDDPLSAELVTDLLEAAGWLVRLAVSGEAAVAVAREEPADVVLLDIGLPGMDGHATMRALRAMPATAGATIIAVTAQAMRGDAERAIAEGFDGYVTKPVDTKRLVQAIEAIRMHKG